MLRGVKKNHILLTLIPKNTKTEVYSSKTMRVGNENVSYFFCVEAIIYLFVYLYNCVFNKRVQYFIGENKSGKSD